MPSCYFHQKSLFVQRAPRVRNLMGKNTAVYTRSTAPTDICFSYLEKKQNVQLKDRDSKVQRLHRTPLVHLTALRHRGNSRDREKNSKTYIPTSLVKGPLFFRPFALDTRRARCPALSTVSSSLSLSACRRLVGWKAYPLVASDRHLRDSFLSTPTVTLSTITPAL